MSAPVATAARGRRFVRGWVVVGGVFGVMMVTSGLVFYALGVYLKAFVDELGFSTGLASTGVSAFLVASGLCGYYTGALVNRFDVRWVITWGIALSAAGMALLSQIRNPWQMFAVMTVFGVGFGLCGLVPTTSVVTRWFQRRRAVALSIASTGLSLGGIVLLPLLTDSVETESLVVTAPRFAVGYAIALVLFTWLFIRAWPHEVGLKPDGDVLDANTSGTGGPPPGTPYDAAVRSRFFVFTAIGFVLVMGSQVGGMQHVYKLTADRLGVEAAATAAVAILAGTSVVARICGGIAAMRVPLRGLAMSLMVVQGVGLAVLATAGSGLAILVGVIVLGAAMGNLLMLHPLILADAFGVRDYPRIYGLGSLFMVTGVAGGPPLVGFLEDAFSYRYGFYALVAVGAVGLFVYSLAGSPVRDYLQAPASKPAAPRPAADRLHDRTQPQIWAVEPA